MGGSTNELPEPSSNFFVVAFEEPHQGGRAFGHNLFDFSEEATESGYGFFGHGQSGFVFHMYSMAGLNPKVKALGRVVTIRNNRPWRVVHTHYRTPPRGEG